MYLDTSYVAKLYLAEPESALVEALVFKTHPVRTSALTLTEFHSVLHRRVNEGGLPEAQARRIAAVFLSHVADGLWVLVPITEQLLRRTSAIILAAPPGLNIRSADAIHLMSAAEADETEIWTSDRNMLGAAGYFGLAGRTV